MLRELHYLQQECQRLEEMLGSARRIIESDTPLALSDPTQNQSDPLRPKKVRPEDLIGFAQRARDNPSEPATNYRELRAGARTPAATGEDQQPDRGETASPPSRQIRSCPACGAHLEAHEKPDGELVLLESGAFPSRLLPPGYGWVVEATTGRAHPAVQPMVRINHEDVCPHRPATVRGPLLDELRAFHADRAHHPQQ